jgi:hypothetical protein
MKTQKARRVSTPGAIDLTVIAVPRLNRGCSLALAIALAKYPEGASHRRVRGRGNPLFVAVQRLPNEARPGSLVEPPKGRCGAVFQENVAAGTT